MTTAAQSGVSWWLGWRRRSSRGEHTARLVLDLEESRARERRAFDDHLAAMFRAGLNGEVKECNAACVRLLGCRTAAELVGHSTLEFYDVPEERARALALLERDGRIAHHEVWLRRPDGKRLRVMGDAKVLRDSGQAAPYIETTLVDITARHEAEQRLRESEQSYRELFENGQDFFYTRDLEGRFTSVNPAAERITGYKQGELLGMHVLDLVAPEDLLRMREQERTQAVSGEAQHDFEIIGKQGQRVAVEVRSRPILREGRVVGVQGTVREVGERRRLEAQLRQAQKMEAVGRLAGGVAHDFNNLLTIIGGQCERLLAMAGDEERRERVGEIAAHAERAAALVRQLLAFSRQQVLQPKVVDLNQITRGVERMLRRLIGEHITVITDLAPDLGRVKADPGQIEQVLLNLAVNARDAMPGGGTLRLSTANRDLPRVEERGRCVGPCVELTVSDTGTGIDAATLPSIFEPFFTTKEVGQGTGLGLSTVHGIVEQSGGHVTVESKLGAGTCFSIYLPRTLERSSVFATGPETAAAVPRAASVLLVEDEAGLRDLIKETLAAQGCAVYTARDGQDALAVDAQLREPLELLITDVVMPGLGGRELAARLGARRPGLKVLYVSGYTEGVLGGRSLPPGSAFLQKPFRLSQLLTAVAGVLNG